MKIQVCKKIDPEKYHHDDNREVIETIERKPFNRGFIGNFVPHWCKYKGREYLIHGGIDYAYMHDVDETGFYIIVDEN